MPGLLGRPWQTEAPSGLWRSKPPLNECHLRGALPALCGIPISATMLCPFFRYGNGGREDQPQSSGARNTSTALAPCPGATAKGTRVLPRGWGPGLLCRGVCRASPTGHVVRLSESSVCRPISQTGTVRLKSRQYPPATAGWDAAGCAPPGLPRVGGRRGKRDGPGTRWWPSRQDAPGLRPPGLQAERGGPGRAGPRDGAGRGGDLGASSRRAVTFRERVLVAGERGVGADGAAGWALPARATPSSAAGAGTEGKLRQEVARRSRERGAPRRVGGCLRPLAPLSAVLRSGVPADGRRERKFCPPAQSGKQGHWEGQTPPLLPISRRSKPGRGGARLAEPGALRTTKRPGRCECLIQATRPISKGCNPGRIQEVVFPQVCSALAGLRNGSLDSQSSSQGRCSLDRGLVWTERHLRPACPCAAAKELRVQVGGVERLPAGNTLLSAGCALLMAGAWAGLGDSGWPSREW